MTTGVPHRGFRAGWTPPDNVGQIHAEDVQRQVAKLQRREERKSFNNRRRPGSAAVPTAGGPRARNSPAGRRRSRGINSKAWRGQAATKQAGGFQVRQPPRIMRPRLDSARWIPNSEASRNGAGEWSRLPACPVRQTRLEHFSAVFWRQLTGEMPVPPAAQCRFRVGIHHRCRASGTPPIFASLKLCNPSSCCPALVGQ